MAVELTGGYAPTLAVPQASSRPLRLTLRGKLAVAVAVVSIGIGLLYGSHLSTPSRPSQPISGMRVVSVQAGDTLWSIAHRLAPTSDPRNTVAQLVKMNHLGTVDLIPGQQLRWR